MRRQKVKGTTRTPSTPRKTKCQSYLKQESRDKTFSQLPRKYRKCPSKEKQAGKSMKYDKGKFISSSLYS